MRQSLLLLSAVALTTTACADSTPLEPAERSAVRPSALIACLPGDPTTVGPIAGLPTGPVAAGSAAARVTIRAAVTGAPSGSEATLSWGDYSPSDLVDVVDDAAQGEHEYTEPGTYTLYVIVGCAYNSAEIVVTEPAPAEPTPTDSTPADPTPADPTPADPTPSDSTPTNPAPTDPQPTDSLPTDPEPTDSLPADPQPSDSLPSGEPGAGDPGEEPVGGLPPMTGTGGFVTGGGWIDAPAGSYGPGAAQSGRGTVGLVVKTKGSRLAPEGNVEFQFHPAKLNFHSRGFDWLAVNGTTATFQGWGTINGAGDYGFRIAVSDGKKMDAFRIRIWDRATGVVVFDNEIGAAADAEAVTRLTNGNVVVHAK